MKKKRVRVLMPKAQEGMQMAEGAPQEQRGGQDQMQQLAMQVQQMLEQGADPAQVVAQLVQGGVPPEVVAQILVGLGMPQEQVMPMIEQVMQQMQGAQQQGPPQEAMSPEGQPMMEDGGEPGDPPDKRKVVSSKDYIDPITGKRVNQSVAYATDVTDDGKIINAFADRDFKAANVIDTTGYSAGATEFPYFQDYETMILENGIAPNWGGANSGFNRALLVNKEIGVPELGKGVTNRMTVDRILEQRKILNKKAMGGESQQEQIMQLIQDFSEATGMDPKQVVEQLQNAKSEEEQQAMLQQMMQTVQQGQQAMKGGGMVPSGYHMMPDGSIMPGSRHGQMDDGGQITELMMGAINPTKGDFLSLKKRMLKEMKAGGTTKGFDSNSTKSYVQNLQGAVANHVSRNMRIGMINQQFDKAMEEFDSLPKAKGGLEFLQNQQQQKTDQMVNTLNVRNYDQSDGFGGLGSENIRISEESVNKGGEGTVQDRINESKHFFPGHGPGQRSLGGKYFPNRYDKTAVGQFIQGLGQKQGTGNYRLVGHGELQGAGMQAINEKMAEIAANPEAYGFDVKHGYLNRRGKIKARPGLFGRPETMQFDYVGKGMPAAADKTNTGLFQPNGETNNQTQEQVAIDPNAPKPAPNVPAPQASGGIYDNEIVAGVLPPGGVQSQEAIAGPQGDTYRQMMEQMIADGTATRRDIRNYEKVYGKDAVKQQKLANDPYYGKTAEEIRQLEPDPKKAEKLIKKYGAKDVSTGYDLNNQNAQTYAAAIDPMITREQALIDMENDAINTYLQMNPMVANNISESSELGQDIMDGQYKRQKFDYTTGYPGIAPYEFGQKMHGGLVSNPGRPVWDFKQMKWSSPKPAQSLLFAEDGLETLPVQKLDERELNPQLMGYGPQGQMQPGQSGFRITEDQVRTTDYGAIGQGIYEGIDWLGNFAQNIKDTPSTRQQLDQTQKAVQVYDAPEGPGTLGFYTQWGDWTAAGAPKRAGTGSDLEASTFTPGFNYQTGIGYSDAKPMFVKNGGLVRAQLGLQVGDELELSERDIMELAKYGYEVTRM